MGNNAIAPFDFNRYNWPPAGNITPTRFVTNGEYIAEGTCRLCYLGKDTVTGQPVVLKKFKKHIPKEEIFWTKDIQASREAQRFADHFNAEMKSSKPIRFIQPVVYECQSNVCAPFLKGEKVLVEPFLGKDVYNKFNSNSGYEDKNCGSTMAAFSHFTYHISDGKMLVCDLQGVKREDEYILTDPVICSVQQTFGVTDVGEEGIRSFFANHECTELCKSIWKRHGSPKQYRKVIMGTTFLL
jgi:hypothetical protein